MINLDKINRNQEPYKKFLYLYHKAASFNQISIEAVCLSTINLTNKSAHSRFVNIKYLDNKNFIFFTNYNSNKAKEINTSSKIALNFFWSSINTQIRIEGKIQKLDEQLSDEHFRNRDNKKNALAISSNQSEKIDSYENIKKNYEIQIEKTNELTKRPNYWGGYTITPYYFEFWEGNEARVNKREAFKLSKGIWKVSIG